MRGGVATEVVVEDGFDGTVGPGADVERLRCGRFDPLRAEGFDPPDDAEAGPEALLWIGVFFQDQVAQRRRRRSDQGGVAPDALALGEHFDGRPGEPDLDGAFAKR